ncbi:MAG: hypothetical protein HY914_17715 [Desulfomonile tiedjei]|nr:hypothetical protein [Desulfomonile tiedjei]
MRIVILSWSSFCRGRNCLRSQAGILRSLVIAFLGLFLVSSLAFAQTKAFTEKEIQIRNMLLKAFTTASPEERKRNLLKVLEVDPRNYFALIGMGGIMLQKGERGNYSANDYFLRAAIEQPYCPDAYLALVQSFSNTGSPPEAFKFLQMGRSAGLSAPTLEAVALEGQYFLDACNYSAAAMVFAEALNPDSRLRGNKYLLSKLYLAAVQTPIASVRSEDFSDFAYWVPEVAMRILGNSYAVSELARTSQARTELERQQNLNQVYDSLRLKFREFVEQLQMKYPRLTHRQAAKIFNGFLHTHVVLPYLRAKIGGEDLDKRFQLGDRFYSYNICPEARDQYQELDPNTLDLYKVFIEASVQDPQQQKELYRKLADVRKDVLAQVQQISDPKEKAGQLFILLREKLLKTYDSVDGIPAEGPINKGLYLCLTGTILYTLIGREAGLDVSGVLKPTHAYAVLHHQGKQIVIETTEPENWKQGSKPDGFGRSAKVAVRRGHDLRGNAYMRGEVSPLELVGCQFRNVGLSRLDRLTLTEYEQPFKDLLREDKVSDEQIERIEDALRHAERSFQLKVFMIKYMLMLAERNETYQKDMVREILRSLDTFSKGGTFNPFDPQLEATLEGQAVLLTTLARANPVKAMKKRRQAQAARDLAALEGSMKSRAQTEAAAEPADPKKKEGAAARPTEQTTPQPTQEEMATTVQEEGAAAPTLEAAEDIEEYRGEVEKWDREKKLWVDVLKALQELVKRHPCSAVLKDRLVDHCNAMADVMIDAQQISRNRSPEYRLRFSDLLGILKQVPVDSPAAFTNPANQQEFDSRMSRLDREATGTESATR